MTATVHVAAFWDEDAEAFWFTECTPGEYADDTSVFEGDVPAYVWQSQTATWRELHRVTSELTDLLGLDSTGPRLRQPCARWNGEEAGPAIPEWWLIGLATSDGTEWPIHHGPIPQHDSDCHDCGWSRSEHTS